MKVLLLTDGIFPFELGGMQKHSFNLAKHLTLKVKELTIVHCTSDNQIIREKEVRQALFEGINPTNVSILFLKFPKFPRFPGHYILSSYRYSKSISQSLKQDINDFDLIYAQGFTAWHMLRTIKNRPPIFLNFHGYNMLDTSTASNYQKRLLKWAVKSNFTHLLNQDKIISLGGKINDLLSTYIPAHQILIEPNGIHRNWLLEHPIEHTNSIRKFIFVGRNDKVKRLDLINQVIKEAMNDNDLTFQFDFVGNIPKELDTNSSKIKITYHGTITDETQLKNIYDQSDVLVLPSDTEGMPTVINEAMARGNAIIATNVGAVAEQVDQTNGWLIPQSSFNELKKAMTQAVTIPPHQLLQMKSESIQKVKTYFLWDKVIDGTLTVFKSRN